MGSGKGIVQRGVAVRIVALCAAACAVLAVSAAPATAAPMDGTAPSTLTVTGTGPHQVTVPAGATAVAATLYGASGPGGTPGVVVAADGQSAGPVGPGQTLTVDIEDSGTSLFSAQTGSLLLSAPAGSGTGLPYNNPAVFPDAQQQSGGNSGPGSATLTFTLPAAAVTGLPASTDFSSAVLGTPTLRTIGLTASGGTPLNITAISATAPFAVENTATTCPSGNGTALNPGTSCQIAVQFTPTARGVASGTLTVTANVPGGSATSSLIGTGVATPGVPGAVTVAPSDGGVTLSWMPPTDDGGSPLTGYQVVRSGGPDPTTPAAVVGTVTAGTLVYSDTGLQDGTTYTYQVKAVSAVGASDGTAPVTAVPTAGLTIASTALASATVGTPYQATLTANGGTAPYRWTLDGTLPPGLDFDPVTGTVSGTATTPGSYQFGVKADDSATPPAEATAQVNITVQPPATPSASGAAQASVVKAGSSGSNSWTGVWVAGAVLAAGLAGGVFALTKLRRRR